MKINDIRLGHKGLLLIAIPLLVSSSFLWVVTINLRAEVAAEQKEMRAKDIEFETEVLQKKLTEAGLATANVLFFHSESSELLDRCMADLPVHIQQLKVLVADDAPNKARADEVSSTMDEILRLVKEGRRLYKSGGRSLEFDNANEFLDTLQQLTNRLVVTLHEIATDARTTQRTNASAKEGAIQSLTTCVVVAQSALIAFAVLFGLAFYKTVTRRLILLVDNIHRFAAEKPLHKPIEGNDEIGQLHDVFHSMATTIVEQRRLKQEFIAMVSHDLRTPLTSIQATLHLLGDGIYGAVPDEAGEQMHFCNSEVDRLMSLVNDILDLDKLESGQMSAFPEETVLQEVLIRSVAAVESLASKYDVRLEVIPNEFHVYADPDRVIQVVINLVSNAIKFSPSHAAVIVSAHECDEFVRIEIADNGRGVPDDMKDRIFERFTQVTIDDSKKKGGTGLGLAICKAIATAHKGEIGIKDNPTGGSIFWFTLPRLRSKKKKKAAVQVAETCENGSPVSYYANGESSGPS